MTQGHRKCQPLTDRVGFFITDPKKYDTLILIRHKIEITLKITQVTEMAQGITTYWSNISILAFLSTHLSF